MRKIIYDSEAVDDAFTGARPVRVPPERVVSFVRAKIEVSR